MNQDLLAAILTDNKIRKKLPTSRERDVIQYVKGRGYAYSRDTAAHFHISQQGAGQLLRSAYSKGFLRRVRFAGPTGETVYRYTYALEQARDRQFAKK